MLRLLVVPDDYRVWQAACVVLLEAPAAAAELEYRPGAVGQPAKARGGRGRGGGPGGRPGLPLAVPGEGVARLPLNPVPDVPGRLAVPPQHEPLGCAQRASPLVAGLPTVTASGSGMTGQSFQMRSSA